jgi:predicted TPR repeat methyltransferase
MAEADEQLLREAVGLHQAGRLDEAAERYRDVLERDPQNPNALNLLGMVHHQRGEHEKAAELLQRAVKVAPGVFGFENNLGNILLALQRAEPAEEAYRRAIALNPDYAEAHNNLGVALMGQGKFDEAIQQLVNTIKMRHNYPAARNNLGTALRCKGMYKEAGDAYRDAITQKPDYAEAHGNLAITLLALGQREEAVEECRRVLALKPDYTQAYTTLGVALELSGRKDEAIAAYREALQRRPNSRRLRFQLASLTGDESFSAAPPDFVAMLFDNYADTFDRHLVQGLQYRAPQLVVDAALSAVTTDRLDVLDMGCGTGLCGPLLREAAKTLTGVDLSTKMIGHARERKVYNQLFVDEIVAFLSVRFSQFDLAVAADVLNYFGDLAPVFTAAAQAMRPGGVVAFTVEKYDGDRWKLNSSRRFGHSIDYVKSVMAATGFDIAGASEVVLRQENAKDVAGWLLVVKKR